MTKVELPLATAQELAEYLQVSLERRLPFNRVDVAGSIRRKRPMVGDIELVADATRSELFGLTAATQGVLRDLGIRRAAPTIRKDGVEVKAPWSDRYMKGVYEYRNGTHVQVDLFIVSPPAEWAVDYLIRTGSADFSHAFVTRLHRWGLKTEQGHVIRQTDGLTIPCATEDAFFKLNRMRYIEPDHREVGDPVVVKAFRDEFP